ncbi:MAG: YbjN domain-containing protein [Alphaproteobacteria bacterium]|nr:YbjN domain-containing protein [Alphaproteobacteria bacterium]
MTLRLISGGDSPANPLDIVEQLVEANEWAFDRSSDDELAVEVTGRWCDFHLFFCWREELHALHFSCLFDSRAPKSKMGDVAQLLALVNERLWLGHFDLSSEDGVTMFRHTVPMRGAPAASVEMVEDLMDVAIGECERFYPAFQFVLWGGKSAEEAIAASMLDTVGEA